MANGGPTSSLERVRRLVMVAVALRVVATLAMLGPWTDEPRELAGWDVARFHQLADQPGRHWVDHEVEYPPGSVVLIEGLSLAGGVVATHRVLVFLSLVVDLATAAALRAVGGNRVAGAHLLLGLPLVPMGLVRLDLWSVGLAVAAVLALDRRRPGLAGGLATAAALVKVWPVLLVAAFLAARQWRAAATAVASGATTGLVWLAYGGWSPAPVGQVLSLRGATGWHLESVPGSLLALFGSEPPRRQLDAFRIGTLEPGLVLAGRAATVAVVVALVAVAWRTARLRSQTTTTPDTTTPDHDAPASPDTASPDQAVATVSDRMEVVALVMLGATAALIVTAPLLSPQFLLWLTPWAALLAGRPGRGRLVVFTAAATVGTGVTLSLYDPPNLGRAVPALLLLGRDLALGAVVVAALAALASSPRRLPGRVPQAVDPQVERNTR